MTGSHDISWAISPMNEMKVTLEEDCHLLMHEYDTTDTVETCMRGAYYTNLKKFLFFPDVNLHPQVLHKHMTTCSIVISII
jgi:hypothetical protein